LSLPKYNYTIFAFLTDICKAGIMLLSNNA
jgi:hypothetical protein